MLNFILNLDTQITNSINAILPHNQFLNHFFSFFSLFGSSILIWIVIIFFLILFEEKKDKRFIIYFLISFIITAFLVNVLIKNIVQRPRPGITCSKDYSFPSGHAATAFASAAILGHFDRKRKYFYYLIASLIGLSRIYLYCHYFLDVVGGMAFGYTIGKIILRFKKLPVKFFTNMFK